MGETAHGEVARALYQEVEETSENVSEILSAVILEAGLCLDSALPFRGATNSLRTRPPFAPFDSFFLQQRARLATL